MNEENKNKKQSNIKIDKYLNINIVEVRIPEYNGCKYQVFVGNRFTTVHEMQLAFVYKNRNNNKYNVYAKLNSDDYSETIVIFGINKLLKNETNVNCFKCQINEDSISYSEFAIFAIFHNDFEKLDDAVKEYINNREYVEFENWNRDNPWLRLIAIKKV